MPVQAHAKAAKAAGKRRATGSTSTEAFAHYEASEVAENIEATNDKSLADGGTFSPFLAAEKEKIVTPATVATSFTPKKTPTRKMNSKPKKDNPILLEAISRAMAIQASEYQLDMPEDCTLKEAIRLSEMGDSKRRSSRAKHPGTHLTAIPINGDTAQPMPTQPRQKTPATPRVKSASQKKQEKKKELKNLEPKKDTDPQCQRPQTSRRLQFSPHNGSEGGDNREVPVASINKTPLRKPPPKCPEIDSVEKPKRNDSLALEAAKSENGEQKQPVKSPSRALKAPKKLSPKQKIPAAEGNRPAKRSRSTEVKASANPKAAKKRKKTMTTPRGGQRGTGTVQCDVMSEEDAVRLALKMSEVEY